MGRTIPRHRPKTSPPGDYQCLCDYCGVQYLRSQLSRDGAGRLHCDCSNSNGDVVTLARIQAGRAERPRWVPPMRDTGTFDHQDDPDPVNPALPGIPWDKIP